MMEPKMVAPEIVNAIAEKYRKKYQIPEAVAYGVCGLLLLLGFFALPMVESAIGFGYIPVTAMSGWDLLRYIFNEKINGGGFLAKIFFALALLFSVDEIIEIVKVILKIGEKPPEAEQPEEISEVEPMSLKVVIGIYMPWGVIWLILYRLLYMYSVREAWFRAYSFGSGWTLMVAALLAIKLLDYFDGLKVREASREMYAYASRQTYAVQDAVNPQSSQGMAGYCPQCGEVLPQGGNSFCPYCGAKIG